MTTAAKVFVVLNLILACVVFGSGASLLGAADNYKTALEETKSNYDDLKNNWDKQKIELDKNVQEQVSLAGSHKDAKDAAMNAKAVTDAQMSKQAQANASLMSTNQNLSSELGAMRKVLDGLKATLSQMMQRLQEQTENAANWQRQYQEASANAARLEQELANCTAENGSLQAGVSSKDAKIKELQFWLDAYRTRFGKIDDIRSLPEGRVLQVKQGDGGLGIFVAISVGSKDNVRVGDTYQLSRGNQYVGSITIIRVDRDSAYGRADAKYHGDAWPPQSQDRAWTD
jgi:predicted RNase H-like nuclease (RuvC/YqgF family)